MNTAMQIRPVDSMNLNELQNLGQVFTKSGFFADTKDAAQAVVKVMAGMELGFPPIASMTGVYIVKGKVSLSANLMAAAIKKSKKYNYRVRQLDEQGCKIEFFEEGESVGFSSFTKADANNAGLAGETWKKFFRNMSFARAMSNGAKWYCADIFGGPIYTPEELGAEVDGETGQVVEVLGPEPSEVAEDLQAHLLEQAIEAEPEPVRNVKLEGAQPTKEVERYQPSASASAGTRQILGLIAGLKWDNNKIRDWIEAEFNFLVADDFAGFFDSLQNAEQQKIVAALKGEFNKR